MCMWQPGLLLDFGFLSIRVSSESQPPHAASSATANTHTHTHRADTSDTGGTRFALVRPTPPFFTQEDRRKLSTHGGVHFFGRLSHTHTHTHGGGRGGRGGARGWCSPPPARTHAAPCRSAPPPWPPPPPPPGAPTARGSRWWRTAAPHDGHRSRPYVTSAGRCPPPVSSASRGVRREEGRAPVTTYCQLR